MLAVMLCQSIPSRAAIYYINAGRPDNDGPGTSWATAYAASAEKEMARHQLQLSRRTGEGAGQLLPLKITEGDGTISYSKTVVLSAAGQRFHHTYQ